MTGNLPTAAQREKLAREILNFLVKNNLWVDTNLYFNGKCWSTHNKETGEYYYNEQKYYEFEDDPRKYFEYVREPENIFSASFEGPLYYVLNGYAPGSTKLEEKFSNIFKKYGLYYEMGYAWSLTCYEI